MTGNGKDTKPTPQQIALQATIAELTRQRDAANTRSAQLAGELAASQSQLKELYTEMQCLKNAENPSETLQMPDFKAAKKAVGRPRQGKADKAAT